MASSAPATPAISRQARLTRAAVATVFFVNGVIIANWITRIPDVKQKLMMSDGTLGLTLLFAALGALVAQPTVGWLISKVGSRRLTVAMMLLLCGALLLPGIAPNVFLLALALFVFGACNGGLDVAMNGQAVLVEHSYGRPIMSSFHGLWSVGGLLGAALGGLLATRGVVPGWHFLGVALPALVIAWFAMRGLVDDSTVPAAEADDAPGFALPPRALLPMGIVALAALICEGAVADWSAIYLRDTLGSNPSTSAAAYGAFALLMAAGRLSGDWLTLRLGSVWLVRGGGICVVAGMILALVGNVPLLAIIGFGLVGAGLACMFPLIMSAASQTPGVAPGTGIAAMATVGYTGFLIGPPLIGALSEVLTLRGALGVLALSGILIVVLSSSVRPGGRAAQAAQ